MIPATWVGIDPGAAETGIVVRRGPDLLWHAVLVRERDEDHGQGVGVGPEYLAAVLAAANTARYLVTETVAGVAVELVVAPSAWYRGKKKFIDPTDAIGVGIVLGAVLARHPDAVRVRPNSHGKGNLATYPAELVTARERSLGVDRAARDSNQIRHCRSAWDVAAAGAEIARGIRRLQILTATGSHR